MLKLVSDLIVTTLLFVTFFVTSSARAHPFELRTDKLADANSAAQSDVEKRFEPSSLPNQAPQVLQAAAGYLAGSRPKALAISREGSVHYVTKGASDAEVGRRALELCVFNYSECALYSINDYLVRDLVWISRTQLTTAGQDFDPHRVPFVTDSARARMAQYVSSPRSKALAIALDGAWGFSAGRSNRTAATEAALLTCQKHARGPCSLYAVDEKVVVDLMTQGR